MNIELNQRLNCQFNNELMNYSLYSIIDDVNIYMLVDIELEYLIIDKSTNLNDAVEISLNENISNPFNSSNINNIHYETYCERDISEIEFLIYEN